MLCVSYALQHAHAQPSSPPTAFDKPLTTIKTLIEEDNNEAAQLLVNKALASLSEDQYNQRAQLYYYKGIITESTTATDSQCIAVYDTALSYATKANNIELQVKCNGKIYPLTSLKDSTLRASINQMMLKTVDTIKSNYVKSLCCLTLARIRKMQGNDGESLQYILKALSIQKALVKKKEIGLNEAGETLVILCRIYGDMQQTDKQLEYIRELRKYTDHNPILLANYYFYYGKNRNQAYKINDAVIHLDSLTTICDQSSNSEIWNMRLDLDMAITQFYASRNNGKNALKYFNDASDVFKKWGYAFYKAQLSYTGGVALYANKNYLPAIDSFKSAANAALGRNYIDLYLICLKKTAQCYAALNQWQNAYRINDSVLILTDSFYNQKTNALFAKAEEEYQNKEKQQKIESQTQELAFVHKQHIWLIAAIIFITLIALWLTALYRNKKRSADVLSQLNKELDEANQTKAQLFSIISHDLRSPVSQVYQFLRMQQTDAALLSKEQKQNFSTKIQTSAASLLDTMENLLLWSKTQMKHFNANIQPIILNDVVIECVQLLQLTTESKHIQVETDIPFNTIVNSDIYFLQTIIRNLLQNAVNASPNYAAIKMHFDNKRLLIRNSGIPFSQNDYETIINSIESRKYLSGLGLRLVHDFSKKINLSIVFETPNQNTTIAHIIFP